MEKPKKANSRVLLYVAMPGEEKKKSLLRLRIFDSSPKIIQEEETSRSRGNGRPCCRRLPSGFEDHANADAEIRTVCHTHMVEAGACTLHNLGRIVVYLSNLRASNASSHSSRLFQFLFRREGRWFYVLGVQPLIQGQPASMESYSAYSF